MENKLLSLLENDATRTPEQLAKVFTLGQGPRGPRGPRGPHGAPNAPQGVPTPPQGGF